MLKPQPITIGSDPELFFSKDGRIIGSEKLIPKDGLGDFNGRIIRDGVQVEFNPKASSYTIQADIGLTRCFKALRKILDDNPGVTVDWSTLVEVSEEEFLTLSSASRELGCQPSSNTYESEPITVDRKKYPKRSAGGHIHIGLSPHTPLNNERVRLVSLFDIFVGNTCVMLDRDPGAVERRKNYGRAGEYRWQSYGIEYRTLSNFWLVNHVVADLVYTLTDIAVATLHVSILGLADLEGYLIDVVDIDKFIRAIDKNDFKAAKRNFESIVVPFIKKYVLPDSGLHLHSGNIDSFTKVLDTCRVTGIKRYFKEDPIDHWADRSNFINFDQWLAGLGVN